MSRARLTAAMQRAVRERAAGCCEYCASQQRFAMQPFAVEHIVPRSRGGKTRLDNLALSCQGCNNHKYAKTNGTDPRMGKSVRLFHPRQQRWGDHFTWNENCILIVGLTPTGRATVEELALNREGLVNLRQILEDVGEHPPRQFSDAGGAPS